LPAYVEASEFHSNTAIQGGGINVADSSCRVKNSVLSGNVASDRGGAFYASLSRLIVLESTCVANLAQEGAGIFFPSQPSAFKLTLENTIVSFSTGGAAVVVTNRFSISSIACTDIFGNAGGDWVGNITPYIGEGGNISADPQFCGYSTGNLELQSDSPCAPEQSGGCGLIGALPVGCGPVSVSAASWGRIKALYR
jgi:hypothetical protein